MTRAFYVLALACLVLRGAEAAARYEEHETVNSSKSPFKSQSSSAAQRSPSSSGGGSGESQSEKYGYQPSSFSVDSATPNSSRLSAIETDETSGLDDVNQATVDLKEIFEARAPASDSASAEDDRMNIELLNRAVMDSVLQGLEDLNARRDDPEEPE